MSESGLTPQPRRGTKTAWVFRTPPEAPRERIFFLLERMDAVLNKSVFADLMMLHEMTGESRLGPWELRSVKRRGHDVAAVAQLVSGMTRELVAMLEGRSVKPRKPRRRRGPRKPKSKDPVAEAWLRQQLDGLGGPRESAP
jgi:hypothetical protein